MFQEAYFARNQAPEHLEAPPEAWIRLLEEDPASIKSRVEQAVKHWNMGIRSVIRRETALRLSTEPERSKGAEKTRRGRPPQPFQSSGHVSIRVVDGVPHPLLAVLDEFEKYAPVILQQGRLRETVAGLQLVMDHYDELTELESAFAYDGKWIEHQDVWDVQTWVSGIVDKIDALLFRERLQALTEDYLGAYYFKNGVIELHWMAIAITAANLGVSVEALTVVTLAHELAHAYTHQGKDIDGVTWPTRHFAHADLHVVEGLAQFYTEVVCKHFEERFPEALEAFRAMLKIQAEPYTCFAQWSGSESASNRDTHVGERVRYAMVRFRRGDLEPAYGQFMKLLVGVA